MSLAIEVRGLQKTFTLHTQGGIRLPVLHDVDLAVESGDCVVLSDPSGSGKSTLLRAIYGNYTTQAGQILVRHDGAFVDMAAVEPRIILEVRRRTLGYVSQFLRVIPRVPSLDVVAEPLRALGVLKEEALERARRLLGRLGIAERLWSLSPVTFSGGEQQRINVARGFIAEYPILLLDEPTASLDIISRQAMVDLILEARAAGTAIIGTFHDTEVREAVGTRVVRLQKEAA